jgi:hypothetical protein
MYVAIMSEPGLWTVGFYDPKEQWNPAKDFDSREDALNYVHYLNGGKDSE